MAKQHTSYATILLRALRLRCPRCGQGKLFRHWFKMHTECPVCGLDLYRGPGFYLGSIYVNYGLTTLLTIVLYFVGLSRGIPGNPLMWSLFAFCLVFPLLMFRHARAVWLAFDQYWDPPESATSENAPSSSGDL